MKMLPEHFQTLKESISPIKQKLPDHRKFIKNEGKAKDVEKRLRWDALWYSKARLPDEWISKTLYEYLNDTHIDTALRQIMQDLGVDQNA